MEQTTISEAYWTNPQYFVKLVDPDENDDRNKCTLVASLTQANRVLGGDDDFERIGIDVFKVNM